MGFHLGPLGEPVFRLALINREGCLTCDGLFIDLVQDKGSTRVENGTFLLLCAGVLA